MGSFNLANFMDGDKIKVLPAKKMPRLEVLKYLASKFETGKIYTEKEVNEVLNKFHTFSDPASLRRELYDNYLINREPDGTKYWIDENKNS